jgi:hypothetical protein
VELAGYVRRTNLRSVICPGCGRVRELTDRHVRKIGSEKTLCNLCRFPARRLPPTNTERRYWLRRFTDDEIAEMAEALFGAPADKANIYAWRQRLDIKES